HLSQLPGLEPHPLPAHQRRLPGSASRRVELHQLPHLQHRPGALPLGGERRHLRRLPCEGLQARGASEDRQGPHLHRHGARELQRRLPRLQRYDAVNHYKKSARTASSSVGCDVPSLSAGFTPTLTRQARVWGYGDEDDLALVASVAPEDPIGGGCFILCIGLEDLLSL